MGTITLAQVKARREAAGQFDAPRASTLECIPAYHRIYTSTTTVEEDWLRHAPFIMTNGRWAGRMITIADLNVLHNEGYEEVLLYTSAGKLARLAIQLGGRHAH